MSLPNYQSFMKPILKFLADSKEYTTGEIVSAISNSPDFNFTPDEREQKNTTGRQSVIVGRIGWAKTYLVQAGLILQPRRAVCVITQRGLEALNSGTEINTSYLRQFDEFCIFAKRSNTSTDSTQESPNNDETCTEDTKTPTEQFEHTINTFNVILSRELLTTIKNSSPVFFENLVVDLMLALGYGGSRKESGKTTGFSQDEGIDGIIKEDKLGLEMIYLQAKRYTDNAVGRPEVQKFVGALEIHHAKKGVFITTSKFTREAEEYVKKIEKHIVLIDGEQLTDLMIEHNLGVSVKQVYEIKAIDFDYFTEE